MVSSTTRLVSGLTTDMHSDNVMALYRYVYLAGTATLAPGNKHNNYFNEESLIIIKWYQPIKLNGQKIVQKSFELKIVVLFSQFQKYLAESTILVHSEFQIRKSIQLIWHHIADIVLILTMYYPVLC